MERCRTCGSPAPVREGQLPLGSPHDSVGDQLWAARQQEQSEESRLWGLRVIEDDRVEIGRYVFISGASHSLMVVTL